MVSNQEPKWYDFSTKNRPARQNVEPTLNHVPGVTRSQRIPCLLCPESAGAMLGKQVSNRCSIVNELHWPLQRGHHFFVAIDTQRLAESGMQIGNLDGVVFR